MSGNTEFSAQEILNRSFDKSNNRLNVNIGQVQQRFNDNVLLTFGTNDGTDADVYYDGTNFIIDVNSGALRTTGDFRLNNNQVISFLDSGAAVRNGLQLTSGDAWILGGAAGPTKFQFASAITDLEATAGFTLSTTVGAITITPTTSLVLNNGLNFIGDTANDNMTVGLTINQGANDDSIFTLKSSDSSGSGLSAHFEADDYFNIRKAASTTAGAFVQGIRDSGTAAGLILGGYLKATAADTTKTTAGRAPLELTSYIDNGSGSNVGLGADENLAAIRDASTTTRFIFDVEGSAHADVAWVAFDSYHDLALLDAFQHEMTGRMTPARYGENPLYYNREYLEQTGIVGQDSWHIEHRLDGRVQQRQMVNFTKLSMLHHGALLQMGDVMTTHEARLLNLEQENKQLRAAVGLLEG